MSKPKEKPQITVEKKEIKKDQPKVPFVEVDMPATREKLPPFEWTLEDELNPLLLGC